MPGPLTGPYYAAAKTIMKYGDEAASLGLLRTIIWHVDRILRERFVLCL